MRTAVTFYLAIASFASAASAEKSSTVLDRIRSGVQAIRIIDTHEHLSPEAVRLKSAPTIFSLLHYVSSDMWADGLDRTAGDRDFASPTVTCRCKSTRDSSTTCGTT